MIVTDKLEKYDTDICIPSLNTVVINESYVTSVDVAFRLAHEMSHIIFGNDDQNAVYAFSIGSNKYSEVAADRNAIKMIAKFIYQDTPLEYRNWANFMTAFGLPFCLEDMVKEIIYK